MQRYLALSVLGAIFISASAVASEPSKENQLTGGAKLGFIYSKTTSSSTSLNSGVWLNYDDKPYKHSFKASNYYTNSQDDDDGVNKYLLNYKFAYSVGENYSVFIDNEYKHDQFETYRHVFDSTVGLQRDLIDTKKTQLTIGGGPGYRYTKRQDSDKNQPGKVEEDIIANAFINGKTKLSDTLSIGGGGNVDYGESNTTYTLDGNLQNTLVENVALVLDTQYIYNTDVAEGKDNDEIYSTVSITYDF
ncbi:DUF481 domain-containing protein [Vibrio palustris]|uniref:Salt-induced outer membrane protein n=1 Tax=Vibrio palustris TaxID=1918946 RepID=A0A1R4B3A6_9VIBR|nr:DUF481 domain-containing protein [Vibrio palustris]SJL83383.1 hypothetical protein VPAL9027_01349 [Vibrio palustris]